MKVVVVISTLAHMGGAERQELYLVQYLAATRDPGAPVARIVELLGSERLRQKLSVANSDRIQAQFSISDMNDFFRPQVERRFECRLA